MSRLDTDAIRAGYSVSSMVERAGIKLRRDGREFKGCCPFHAERTPSFHVVDDKEFYHCFGCGAHGDVVDFVMAFYGVPFKEACGIITGSEGPLTAIHTQKQRESVAVDVYAGLKPLTPRTTITAGKRTPPIFNPKRADDEKKHTVTYTPSMVFPYLSATGELLGYVLRVEFDDAKITPTIRYAQLPDGTEGWTHWHFDEPRPLYGLDKMAASPASQVFVCEGEKAADACARLLGVVAITWPGGTNAVDKADWSVLNARKVVLWPDADAPGWDAMQRIAALLQGVAAEVKIIDPRDQPLKGWDAADAEHEGMTRAEALAWGKKRISVWALPPTPEKVVDASTRKDEASPTLAALTASTTEPEHPPISDEQLQETLDRGGDVAVDEPGIDWHPFRILGYNKGKYFYLPRATQQVIELSPSAHTPNNLMALAPLEHWSQQYADGKKMSSEAWAMAYNALMATAARKGIFEEDNIRGRGAWVDKGRAVFHSGPSLFANGVECRPTDFASQYVYEAAPSLSVEMTVPATTKEAHKLADICDRLSWDRKISGKLLVGWCVIAPVCGVLHWRPHVWVTGPSGSGKTTVISFVESILGKTVFKCEGGTTAAGVRQSLNYDARPVMIDEAEAESARQQIMMDELLTLARISSSGGRMAKGSADNKAKTFTVRSCFFFSSINTSVSHHADETRITKLVLKAAPDTEEAKAAFEQLERDIHTWFTEEYAARLLARTLANITTLKTNIATFTRAANSLLGSKRPADQIAPLLAGLYLCHSTKEITLDEAKEFIQKYDWEEHAKLDRSDDELRLLSAIMAYRARVATEGGIREFTLGELVLHVAFFNQTAYSHTSGDTAPLPVAKADAIRELGRCGIKVFPDDGAFCIINKAREMETILRGTPWTKDWVRPLRALPGAKSEDVHRYSPALRNRGTRLSVELLKDETVAMPTHADELPYDNN